MKVNRSLLLLLLLTVCCNVNAQDLEKLKTAEKFKISGQLGASMVFYNVDGREANRPAFSWMVVGNPVVTVYGISLPFSFTVSEQQRSFQQPFNKIGVSPSYKWAKLHLGYRNVIFSHYTLGGHSILGAGGEFTPGKFRIGFMYGQLLKPVQINPLIPDPQTSAIPTYRRNGMAFKLGYGTADNSVDFVLFRGIDVAGSLDDPGQTVLPGANSVFSVITHQKFLKKILFDLEFANSIYTEDTRLSGDPGKTMPPVYSLLITNNITTTSSNAIETSLGYDSKVFDIKFKFKQLDPGFRSMGTFFMQNNIRNITIEPALSLAKNKYVIGGSLGFQRDNLKNSLAHQTNRTIGSVRFTGNPVNWYRADITYSNYDIAQTAGLNPLDPDNTLNQVSQTTQSINVIQNFSLTGKTISQNLLLSLNDQLMTDHVNNSGDFKTLVAMGSYVIGYMPLRMNLSLTYTYSSFDLPGNVSLLHGPSVSWSASMLKSRLNLSLACSRFSNIINDVDSGNISAYSLSSTLKIAKRHIAKLRLYVNNGSGISPYTETKGELGYGFIF
jgi:hypothetical protein